MQVRAFARSLDPRTSQPFMIKWFLEGLRDESFSCYVKQQQPVTLDMAILFVIHHCIRRLCHDINEIVTRLPTIPTKDQLAERRNRPQRMDFGSFTWEELPEQPTIQVVVSSW